jgi:peptide/nickel transport system substrate-binding protein
MSKDRHSGFSVGRDSAHLLERSLSRRTLGKYAAATAAGAATAGVAPLAGMAQESTPGTSPDRPRGGSLTLALGSDADTLDPHKTLNFSAICAYNNMFDSLVGIAEDRTFEGILAESWEISEDGLEYTFHLRDGIQFHNGEPMNADAVKFSLDRVLDPATKSPSASTLSALKETAVIDPLTVKLTLNAPYSPFLTYLSATYYGGAIVPPGAVQEMGDDFGRNPIGTGPWKFKAWASGARIDMVRNDAYVNYHSYVENKGAPYLDELSVAIIPEDDTKVLAFETGEIQVMQTPPSEVANLQENSDYQVIVPTSATAATFLEFAMVKIDPGQYGAQWKAPFDDVRTRQAVACAIDIDSIIKNLLFGLAIHLYGPMESGLFAYKPEIEQYGYHYDPEKAKALLDEAGWVDAGDGTRAKDGVNLEVQLWCWTDGTMERVAQVLQNQLAQVGIAVQVQTLETGTFLATVLDSPANFALSGRGSPEPDVLRSLIDSDYNLITYYQDEQYLDLVTQASVVTDQTERTELYFEAQQKMLADCAWVPLWSQVTAMSVRDAKGFKLIPLSENVYCYEDMYYEN